MVRKIMTPFLLFLCLFCLASADERDPLLNVDELIRLEASYEQFLGNLGDLLIEKGLMTAGEKAEWITMQMGDYLSNGGYGSILTSFYPGVLEYSREEEQICEPSARLELGTVSLLTMRRYSPMETTSDGLMLQMNMTGTDGAPLEVRFTLSGTDGVFYCWDALSGGYQSVGSTVEVEGETVFWVLPIPVEGQVAPVLQINVTETETGRFLGQIVFELEVEKNSYIVSPERFRTAVADADTTRTAEGPDPGTPPGSREEEDEDPNG
ncbi:MAG: hypothetical protein IJ088_09955 [Clostridia bacterium]|nr:hypothetical protein [Clostridia bacterium]